MFTGLVAEVGRIAKVQPLETGQIRLSVTAAESLASARRGDSISVNGVCLTVVELHPTGFTADVMAETLERTTLGGLTPGAAVNLESAATPATALGGHIVQGHVDGTGLVIARNPSGDFDEVDIAVPADLVRYIAEKGSIAVEGVSLTVAALGRTEGRHWFRVALIPATLQHTTLGSLEVGDQVNLEVDVLAKYVERMISAGGR